MPGNVATEPAPARSDVPQPEFAVTGAAHVPYAAAPTMEFSATVSEPAGHAIQTLVLSTQVMIDPARRGYDDATRARLAELFGPPARWTPSTQGLIWARIATVVPGFAHATTFGLAIPCPYDLEVAAAKYFYALADGAVPLSFHFAGTVFYRGDDGRLQVAPVPWTATARFSMPVAAWRAMIAEHYPGGGWVRVSAATLQALQAQRAARGLASFDACVDELLREAADAR